MTTIAVDEGLLDAARCAAIAGRRAEHALREAVAALHEAGVAGPAGYRSTPRLLEDLLRVDRGEATRLLAHAEATCERTSFTGEALDPALPATAAATRDGAVGTAHVRVIARVMELVRRIPGLEPAVVADAEAALADRARALPPAGLARVGARLLAILDPDGTAPDDPPEPEDELHLGRRRDGTLALSGLVHGGADAETIVEVLDALSTPAGPDDPRGLGRRRVEALLDLCAQALSPTGVAAPDDPDETHADETHGGGEDEPSDRDEGSAPRNRRDPDDGSADRDPGDDARGNAGAGTGGATAGSGRAGRATGCPPVRVLGRALLTVAMDHRWLRGAVGHGLLDSDAAISPAEARRLACDAGIVPTVLGSRSEPLDIGRLSYTVPDGMRRALHHRDRGCTFPGCTRRPKRCHAHHVQSWVDGGPTSLENLTSLCRYHHHLVHHGHRRIEMIDGRPWFVPPRWIDADRRPIPGGARPLADEE